MYDAQAFLQREGQTPSLLPPLTDGTSMQSRTAHSKVPGAGSELAWLCQPSVPQETGLSHQLCLSGAPHWSSGAGGRFRAGRQDRERMGVVGGTPTAILVSLAIPTPPLCGRADEGA